MENWTAGQAAAATYQAPNLSASRCGELVSREEIKESLLGADIFVDFEQGLNLCIKKIRCAVGDNSHAESGGAGEAAPIGAFELTVHGVSVRPGYRKPFHLIPKSQKSRIVEVPGFTFVYEIALEHDAPEGARDFGRLPLVDSLLEMEFHLSC